MSDDCEIEAVPDTMQPQVAPLAEAPKPTKQSPQGLGYFVAFYTHGDPSRMVAEVVECGGKWLAIRSGQNGYKSGDFAMHGQAIIDECKRQNIAVYTWHYGTPSHYPAEIAHVLMCKSMGVDGHVLDLEQEWQEVPHAGPMAVEYMTSLRAVVGEQFWLAHCPFDFPSLHAGFPYNELAEFCDAVMPQAYWTEHHISMHSTNDRVTKEWASSPIPVIPVGVTYGHGPYGTSLPPLVETDPRDFVLLNNEREAVGLYTLEAANGAALDLLRAEFGPK